MHLARLTLKISCLVSALCHILAPDAGAGVVKYPAANPAFQLELPEGWTAEEKPGGAMLTCASPNGEANILFCTSPRTYTMQEAMTALPVLVHSHYKFAADAEVELKPARLESPGPPFHQIPFVYMVGRSIWKEVRFRCAFFLFTTPAGRSFLVETMAPAISLKAHKDELEAIIDSVGPVD